MSSTLRFGVIGLMLVTVLALGMIVVNMTRPISKPVTVVQTPAPLTVNQLVAAHPIPAGTLAKDEDFAVKPVPSADMSGLTDSPENRSNLRGALIRHYVDAGTPITLADVLQPRDRGFIASVLRDGYRAVAVGVDQVSGVAGLIWPGDHVDILLTQEMEGAPAAQKALGETVITDVRVIAIDQDMVQSAPNNNTVAGKVVRTVTVEVDPMQAQKLAVAATMGKLSLTIRSASEHPMTAPGAVFGADVSPALSEASAKPTGRAIQVFNGEKHQELKFR